MRKGLLSFVCVMLFSLMVRAQERKVETITIEECQKWALENYPMIKVHDLVNKAREYTLANLSRTYLPQFSLTANALFQSEGFDFPEKVDVKVNPQKLAGQIPQLSGVASRLPEEMILPIELKLPETSKDYYNAGLMMTQVLWAGGRVKAGKEMVKAETDMMHKEADAGLYAIKSKVNELYFGILLIDGRIGQLEEADEIVMGVRKRAEVALKEGVVYPTDLDRVDVERLKYSQLRDDLLVRRAAYLNILSCFIHRPLSSVSQLQIPEEQVVRKNEEISRPELDYLEFKKKRLDADLKMINAENMPKLGLFVSGNFGKGSLIDFDDDFSMNAMGGIHLSWKFGKLYTLKNDRRLVRLKQEGVNLEKKSFIFNTQMEVQQCDMEVNRLRKLMEGDAEIVRLRENIMKSSQVKYDNGVYTISELIMDVNYARIAKQEMLIRELELKMALYFRKITAGEDLN